MAREELNRLNQEQQRLVERSPKQLKQTNKNQKQTQTVPSENIDTVKQNSRKWSLAGIIIAGLLVATAGVGSQLKTLTRQTAPQPTPTAGVNNANAPAAVTPQQEQSGQMLLGQAKLLAQQGEPQQLAQAIAMTQKVPAGVTAAPEAQSLSTTWSESILESAKTQAEAGQITEAIATANLVPTTSQQHQQAQQQIQQWQQAQAQAQQQQFSQTLAAAARPEPLPPMVTPAPAPPVTTTTVAVEPTPAVQPEPVTQAASQPASQPAVSSNTGTQQQTSQVKKPGNPPGQAQSLANDPYLNVQIPQTTAQTQLPASSSSVVALNSNSRLSNSYGFNNLVATAPTVAIQLRDNVDEDGDYVSLIVNGEVYASNEMIYNHGQVIMVDLLPGENKIEIEGLRDGGGGITLEVNVAGVGNVNKTPIPEGSTASFIINRQ